MADERRTFTIPEGEPEGLSGVISVQNQMRAVLAGLQEAAGDARLALAEMQAGSRDRAAESKEHGDRLEELRRLIIADGDRSLIVRMAIVEQTQKTLGVDMREHRIAVEAKLDALVARGEQQGQEERDRKELDEREARARRTQIGLAIAAGAISILTCLITLLVGVARGHP